MNNDIIVRQSGEMTYYIICGEKLVAQCREDYYSIKPTAFCWQNRLAQLIALVYISPESVNTMARLRDWLLQKDEYGDIIGHCMTLNTYRQSWLEIDADILANKGKK